MSTQTMSEQIALLKNIIANLRGQVEEADATLERIRTALEEESGAATQETDFTRLRYEGGKHPYTGHPATRSSMPELYYLLLLTVLTSAEATEAQWMHLYRVAAGAGYEQDVRDLLPAAHAITDTKVIECIENLHRDSLVNAFLLDAMLLSLLREESPAMLEYIAGLFALIGAPRETVNETIQAAKAIAAQDREMYFKEMCEAEYLYAQESCCYLYKLDNESIVNDLTLVEFSDVEHITLVGMKIENGYMQPDTWKAEKITFRDCIFENIIIQCTQKDINFIGCSFSKKGDNEDDTYLILEKSSSFSKCTFKNIISNGYTLHLSNATIEYCTFTDCAVHSKEGYQTLWLKMSNGTITNSKFIRCRCDSVLRDDSCDFLTVINSSVIRCSFSHCEINGEAKYSSSVIDANNSVIKNCHFEQCASKNNNTYYGYMVHLYQSKESNNIFSDCSCDTLICTLG